MTIQMSLDPGANLDVLINRLFTGNGGPWPMPPKQHDLLRLLQPHKGSENARPLASIIARLGMPARDVKAAVKSLVEDFGIPIGGSRQEPYGYFLIVTPSDLEKALQPLRSEVQSIARRVRALAGNEVVAEMFDQVKLNLDERTGL